MTQRRPFSLFLRDLLDTGSPAALEEQLRFLQDFRSDLGPCAGFWELVDEVGRVAQRRQGAPLDQADIVLGQPLAPGGGGDLSVHAHPQGAQHLAAHLVTGSRFHPRFLAMATALLAPVVGNRQPQEPAALIEEPRA